MDIDERIKRALAELGEGAKVVKAGNAKKKQGKRPRKLSSLVKCLGKNAPSAKDRYRQCGKKRRYRSEHDARLSANNGMTKRGTPLRVYRCPICNGWHITKRNADQEQE